MFDRVPMARRILTLVAPALVASTLTAPLLIPVAAHAAPAGTCSSQWMVVASPQLEGSTSLYALDVRTADDAWALGANLPGHGIKAITERWDGADWTLVPVPNSTKTGLQDVDALAADDAWAVGSISSPSGSDNLALRWNGSSWNAVPTPAFSSSTILYRVEAISAGDAWAVGRRGGPGINEHPLALHWDGATWTDQRAGLPNDSKLTDLAIAGGQVWALGNLSQSSDYHVYRWDGSSWQEDASAPDVQLIDGGPTEPLWGLKVSGPSYHHHGVAWTRRSTAPPPHGFRDTFLDLDVAGQQSVWAAGFLSDKATFDTTTLIQHWDGAGWSITPTPTPNNHTALVSIDVANGRGFAVGYRRPPGKSARPYVLTACGV